MTQETHSPLPWVDNGDGWIFDAKGECIGCLDNYPDTAIGVKAVNSHATHLALIKELVEALEPFADYYTKHWPEGGETQDSIIIEDESDSLVASLGDFRRARTSLAKAREVMK
jgi:hypothetical protein